LEDELDVTSSSQEELDQDHLNQPQQPRGEQLPRNAKGSFLQPRRQPQPPHSVLVADPSTSPPPQPQPQSPSLTSSSLHAQFLPQPATERTPLLNQPSSFPDTTSHPHPQQHGIIRGRKGSIGGTSSLGGGGGRQRRGSTFSRENWKAAIEEHRGESTWGQTLFNTYVSILPFLFLFLSLVKTDE